MPNFFATTFASSETHGLYMKASLDRIKARYFVAYDRRTRRRSFFSVARDNLSTLGGSLNSLLCSDESTLTINHRKLLSENSDSDAASLASCLPESATSGFFAYAVRIAATRSS